MKGWMTRCVGVSSSIGSSVILWYFSLSGPTHFVLFAVWYPLMKASFVLMGFQGWIPACTLICVFYFLIQQLYPGKLRKQYTILQRGSQPVSEASKANSSASDWRWAYVPRWPGFPQDTGWTNSAFSCEPLPNSTEKPQQALKQDSVSAFLGASFSFGHHIASLLLNSPLWISFSRRSRDQPYPNMSFSG